VSKRNLRADLRSCPKEGSFQPGTVEESEGHGSGTALQARGRSLPAHGLLFITTNVTIIISVDLHLGKAKVIYLLVLYYQDARFYYHPLSYH
jgi:hypothetical protein